MDLPRDKTGWFDSEEYKRKIKEGKFKWPCDKCGELNKMKYLKFNHRHQRLCRDCRGVFERKS